MSDINLYGVEIRERNMSYCNFIIIAELSVTFQQHNSHEPLPWNYLYIIGLKKTLFVVIFVVATETKFKINLLVTIGSEDDNSKRQCFNRYYNINSPCYNADFCQE
jgi:hypothetical protein